MKPLGENLFYFLNPITNKNENPKIPHYRIKYTTLSDKMKKNTTLSDKMKKKYHTVG